MHANVWNSVRDTPTHLFCSMSSETDLNVTRRVEMTSPEVSATAAAESGDTPEGAPAPIIMEGVPGVEGKPPPLLFRSPAGRGEAAAGSEREGGGSGSPRSRCTSASSWRGGDVCGGNVRVASTGVRTSWWLCERRWLASIYLCLYSLPPHHTHLCQLLLHVACPQLQSPALALQAVSLRNRLGQLLLQNRALPIQGG